MQERGGERRTGRPRRGRHGARRVDLKKRTRGATRSPKSQRASPTGAPRRGISRHAGAGGRETDGAAAEEARSSTRGLKKAHAWRDTLAQKVGQRREPTRGVWTRASGTRRALRLKTCVHRGSGAEEEGVGRQASERACSRERDPGGSAQGGQDLQEGSFPRLGLSEHALLRLPIKLVDDGWKALRQHHPHQPHPPTRPSDASGWVASRLMESRPACVQHNTVFTSGTTALVRAPGVRLARPCSCPPPHERPRPRERPH
ncbi:unnamed protein product [Prorocentrum cordatum]|uniref:Uncharacterized protein n=1 Tax=Prorocentrum cordatum TaxID=2364126 RepID=A0ABN9SJU3_9DINO|nr:unnamed protein product [Polarella glacialis]